MEMDVFGYRDFFDLAITVVIAMVGFAIRRIFTKIDNLERQDHKLTHEINTLRVNLPTNYVTKEDLKITTDLVIHKLELIEEKLYRHAIEETQHDREKT